MAYLETPVGIKLNEFETIMNITLKLNEREFQFSLYYIIPLGKWKEISAESVAAAVMRLTVNLPTFYYANK